MTPTHTFDTTLDNTHLHIVSDDTLMGIGSMILQYRGSYYNLYDGKIDIISIIRRSFDIYIEHMLEYGNINYDNMDFCGCYGRIYYSNSEILTAVALQLCNIINLERQYWREWWFLSNESTFKRKDWLGLAKPNTIDI